ncbi:hypothetical protein [Limnohabitans sp. Bal53]|uniref:capsular polysaccharide export protein, LipB/KpsS family n=1 Tax=Limnohabitans sp. Bal53 TaxID=1977910 RepID=UPI000D343460|nr:hypothetical protein [Limnohabitans sp. Bal53]PUE42387.1 hypothetical protein B9Z50_00475 [Limnohabitans sp. Bal53]
MTSVVFFHRCELTDLFAPVSQCLHGEFQPVHLAYSATEAERLRELGFTAPVTIFKDEVKRLHPSSVADADTLKAIDDLFIQQSGGAFNLNGAIQSDRGFALLSLEEAQRLTVTYYRFWSEFLDRHDANIVLHETCSLMFNFVAAMLCAQRKGHYLYSIMALGLDKGYKHLLMSGFDFTCPDLDKALAAIESRRLQMDEPACRAYLDEFRSSFSVFLGGAFKRPSLTRISLIALRNKLRQWVPGIPHDRVLDNIDYWSAKSNVAGRKLSNLRRYKKEVRFDAFDASQPYYFYPLHLEPEAVVLYHAHGLYANQVKLIQNIAAQLPPGVFLYVKDHPHDHGYRSADDYLALKSVPNIRLLETSISGKEIVAHSQGVITMTGTAGFEALLLGKPVFTFGKTFYSPAPGVELLRHVRDLRERLYAALERPPTTDAALYPYLTAYLHALHPGMTDYFAGRAVRYGLDLQDNARQVAEGLLSTLRNTP